MPSPSPDAFGSRVRYAVGFGVTAAAAAALDLWLRLAVLRRFAPGHPRRIAGVERVVKAWGRAVFGIARSFLRLEVRVEGAPPATGRYVVVSNHQSSLDIPLLITTLATLDLKFVAMEQLRRGHLVISPVLRNGGGAFVKKESLSDDLVELTRFGREVGRGSGCPLIFPEGGISRDGVLRPFRLAGIEAVRRASGLPLLPVTVDGLWSAPSIKEYRRLTGARLTVRIGVPVPFETIERDPRGAYDAIESGIRSNLREIRGEGESQEAGGAAALPDPADSASR